MSVRGAGLDPCTVESSRPPMKKYKVRMELFKPTKQPTVIAQFEPYGRKLEQKNTTINVVT